MKSRIARFGGEDVDNKVHFKELKHLENKLKWTEHKAPPVPILKGSNILQDSLYLYGVDYMSTSDVKTYFSRYQGETNEAEEKVEEETFQIKWINDSSCVVKFPSEDIAKMAYFQMKLSEARDDDVLPPLNLYLEDLQEIEKRDKEKKIANPDYDDLFAD